MLTFGLLASHYGSNARAIVNACDAGHLHARPGVIITNNAKAAVLQFAADAGVPYRRIGGSQFADDASRDDAILDALREHAVDLVVLVGYMKLLGPRTISAFRGRILNTHSALLPRHGGKGMYGLRVHQAVLQAGDLETGITVHLVDEHYDHGATIAQCKIAVEPGDTPDVLAERVQTREYLFLVETLQAIASGTIRLPTFPLAPPPSTP